MNAGLWLSTEFTDKLSNDNDSELHLNHLEQVFNRFRDANLTLKPSKCEFVMKEVKYIGHIISG
jgi:hypothetical protein